MVLLLCPNGPFTLHTDTFTVPYGLFPVHLLWALKETAIFTRRSDDQPKLRGSGVVVTLVCECARDLEGILGVFQLRLVISRGAVKH